MLCKLDFPSLQLPRLSSWSNCLLAGSMPVLDSWAYRSEITLLGETSCPPACHQ